MIIDRKTKGKFQALKSTTDPRIEGVDAVIGSTLEWVNGSNVLNFEKFGPNPIDWSVSSQSNKGFFATSNSYYARRVLRYLPFDVILKKSNTFEPSDSDNTKLMVKKNCSLSVKAEIGCTIKLNASPTLTFYLFKNGVQIPFAKAVVGAKAISIEERSNISITIPVDCQSNDYIQLGFYADKDDQGWINSDETRVIIEEEF